MSRTRVPGRQRQFTARPASRLPSPTAFAHAPPFPFACAFLPFPTWHFRAFKTPPTPSAQRVVAAAHTRCTAARKSGGDTASATGLVARARCTRAVRYAACLSNMLRRRRLAHRGCARASHGGNVTLSGNGRPPHATPLPPPPSRGAARTTPACLPPAAATLGRGVGVASPLGGMLCSNDLRTIVSDGTVVRRPHGRVDQVLLRG